MFSDNLAYWLT